MNNSTVALVLQKNISLFSFELLFFIEHFFTLVFLTFKAFELTLNFKQLKTYIPSTKLIKERIPLLLQLLFFSLIAFWMTTVGWLSCDCTRLSIMYRTLLPSLSWNRLSPDLASKLKWKNDCYRNKQRAANVVICTHWHYCRGLINLKHTI